MDVVDVLVNGGAIGIAIALILYLWQKDKMFNKTLGNHFEHQTDALDRNTNIISENTDVIKDIKNVIEFKLK